MKEYLCILKAVANKTRLDIIFLLKEEKVLSVLEIAEKLNLEQTRLSHALRCLRNCGLVKVEEKGKFRNYKLNKKFTNNLFKVLDLHLKEYKEHIISCNFVN